MGGNWLLAPLGASAPRSDAGAFTRRRLAARCDPESAVLGGIAQRGRASRARGVGSLPHRLDVEPEGRTGIRDPGKSPAPLGFEPARSGFLNDGPDSIPTAAGTFPGTPNSNPPAPDSKTTARIRFQPRLQERDRCPVPISVRPTTASPCRTGCKELRRSGESGVTFEVREGLPDARRLHEEVFGRLQ